MDVAGIVAKLMQVEQQPLAILAKSETSYQAKLSGFGTLKGALSSFQTSVKGLSDISKFQAVKAAVTDPLIASVTGNASAKPGDYSLNVTQLASSQKLVAAGVASQATPVGKGVITFDFGTISGGTYDAAGGKYTGATFTTGGKGVKTVTIDDTNNSLAGMRDAINAANIGVSAKIVNDGGASPYRLSLTSTATGKEASMKVSVADTAPDTGLSALLNHDPAGAQGMSQTAAAQNAEMTIDGIAVSKSSNTVTDVIEGLSFNLLKVSSAPTSVSVTRDTASVTASVNAFVKAYNDITQTLRDAQAYNKSTDKAAVLNGEASVRGIQTQVRNVLSAAIGGATGGMSTLSQIGVAVGKDGLLAVDTVKLDKAIANNFSDLAGLFAAAGKTSNALAAYGGSTADTKAGTYAVEVTKVATRGSTLATAAVAGLTVDATNNSMTVKLNGLSATVTLEQKTYASAAELAKEVQSKINGVEAFSKAGSSVEVTETGGVLNITSNLYGTGSGVAITEGGTQILNFNPSSNINPGIDVEGTINGKKATGAGQLLTGATGDDSAGLRISINGGVPGPMGTVSYSKGYAYQFDQMLTGILGSTGSLASRTDGINASIKGIEKKRADLNARLVTVEKRYMAQFTALDMTLGKMTTTSSYLSQQLSALANLN